MKGQATRWPQGIMVSALLAGTHMGQDYKVNKEGRVRGGHPAHTNTSDPERIPFILKKFFCTSWVKRLHLDQFMC